MKCLCGYAHYEDYEIEDMINNIDFVQGDEKFLRSKNSMFFDNENSYYSDTIERSVYACPKCGTLKIKN